MEKDITANTRFISNKIEVNMETNKRDKEIFYTDRTIHHDHLTEIIDLIQSRLKSKKNPS